MKKLLLVLSIVLLFDNTNSYSQSLLHYWNFNNSRSEAAQLIPSSSIVPGAAITHIPGGTSAIQTTSNTAQGFDVTNPNSRNGDAALTHLRFNNPIGGTLIFSLPTTGFKDVLVKYGTRRSGSGAGTQVVEYTANGSTYIPFTTIAPVDGNPTLQTLDFSSIAEVNNNPHFKIRVTFEAGSGGTVGNNRFDNFTAEGNSIGGSDTIAPSVTFNPVDNATIVSISVQPTLTFSEDIRLVNDNPIDNTTADNLVELRLNDVNGALVAFDASIAGREIKIIPASPLASNQKYYLAVKGNVIEDLNGNVITSAISSVFTTLAPQTSFQSGDLVFVAYRMNATSTDDEIAFLTLIDILPGTMINFTDAKYTDNAQPQCPGGIVWTAPSEGVAAGTVIAIKNDALTTNKGTISGASFGLSSGGDQVIVYTGTPQNPNYITALSSNAWLASNVVCNGSNSRLPTPLTDGFSSINLSTASGNVSGNTVNAFYNGPQTGTKAQLKSAILNPSNWIGTAPGTAPQTWPTWAFPGPPSVVSVKVINQTTLQIIFNSDLNPASATNFSNFTGIAGLNSITGTNNGSNADTLTLSYASPFANDNTYTLKVSGVKDSENRSMVGTYTFSFNYSTKISFDKKFLSVFENEGSITLNLKLENPSASSVDVVVKGAPFSKATSEDFTLVNQTLNFDGTSSNTQSITIPIINDNLEEQDEYFVISLENASGVAINGSKYITIYIKDEDRKAPVATKEIELSYVSSFAPFSVNGSTTEIVVHDPLSQRLFMTSAVQDRLDIADFSNPASITLIKSINMAPYGGITSVAVKNGIVAVASPNVNEQLNGMVVFFDTDGNFLKQVTVGALPDMITFSPDGNKILTANEGQPNDAYTVDPEGSVSIIDISGGINSVNQSKVTTLSFESFNGQEASLLLSGVRKLKASSTLSQDFEPEYVTVSADSKKAWVVLQENNAIAEIDLHTNSLTNIWPLGTKDFNAFGNGFDASDNSGVIHLSNWPVKAFYIPDGLANYKVGSTTYLVTANEGDEKEYAGLNERTTVGNASVILDPTIYPNSEVLKADHNLGRLRISNLLGDTDKDGDYDQLFVNGARSFSIWNAETRALVYDSKDDFELITSQDPAVNSIFNADNEGNGFKSRSRAKGPEPEGVTVAQLGGETYAFVALERVGGVMVYNITDPGNVKFVDYKNSRSTTTFEGDHGPEGIIYISGKNSPDGKHYIAVANEISGTVSIFEVLNVPCVKISSVSHLNTCKGAEIELSYNTYCNVDSAETFGAQLFYKSEAGTTALYNLDNTKGGLNKNDSVISVFIPEVLMNEESAQGKFYIRMVSASGWVSDTVQITLNGKYDFNNLLHAGGKNNDQVYDMASDHNGNSYIVGSFSGAINIGGTTLASKGLTDAYIAKLDAQKNVIWVKKYGESGQSSFESITLDPSGNLFIAGHFKGKISAAGISYSTRGQEDVIIVKLSSDGTEVWSKRWGGQGKDKALGIATDQSGELYVTGSFSKGARLGSGEIASKGNTDIFVAKYSGSTGALSWLKTDGGNVEDWGADVAVNNDGKVGVIGTTSKEGKSNEIYIAIYDTQTGDLIKRYIEGGNGIDNGNGIIASYDGSFNITGNFSGNITFIDSGLTTQGGEDLFVAKLSSEGNLQWVRNNGSKDSDRGRSIAADSDGNLYLTGWNNGIIYGPSSLFKSDVYILKYDFEGNNIWTKTAGGSLKDIGRSISVSGSEIIVSGIFEANAKFGDLNAVTQGAGDIFIVNLSCAQNTDILTSFSSSFTAGNEQDRHVIASPNPFKGTTNLFVKKAEDLNLMITIYDSFGREVFNSKKFKTNENITLGEGLEKGVYLVKIIIGGSSVESYRIIKSE